MKRGNPVYYVCKCGKTQTSATAVSGDIHNRKDTDLLKCPACGHVFTRKEWESMMIK